MGKSLGYRTSVSGKYGGKSLGMQGLYRGMNPFPNYSPIRGLRSLGESYTVGMFELAKYFSTIAPYGNNNPVFAAKPYGVEPKAKLESYKQAGFNNKDFKIGCRRCGAELNTLGICTMCGWSPLQENVKKGILYEQ